MLIGAYSLVILKIWSAYWEEDPLKMYSWIMQSNGGKKGPSYVLVY